MRANTLYPEENAPINTAANQLAQTQHLRIGDYTVDLDMRCIFRDASITRISPKATTVLSCLIRNAGSVVSRDRLLDEGWNSRSASDELLTQAIKELRHAFSDRSKSPQYIQTIPKGGYRLVAAVEHASHTSVQPASSGLASTSPDRLALAGELVRTGSARRELRIAASHYVVDFLLVDILKAFLEKFPQIALRVSTRTEHQILADMQVDPSLTFGICAPIDFPRALFYQHWFAMDWYFVAPHNHPLLKRRKLVLAELCDQPLIVFEPDSTGRQHVLEAFYRQNLTPQILMEATSTQNVLRLVQAGVGVAIIPLSSGIVIRDVDVGQFSLSHQIRPIASGVFSRIDAKLDAAALEFSRFLLTFRPC